MRSMPVVEVNPGRQGCAPGLGRGVGPAIRPFPQGRLDEPLGLAVGLRPVGPRELLFDAEFDARATKRERVEGWAVVGEDALHRYAELGEIGNRFSQEALGAVLALVWTHGGEGHSCVIVDSNEQVLIA